MQREIKFRFVYKNRDKILFKYYTLKDLYAKVTPFNIEYWLKTGWPLVSIDQYTGQKDKKGIEIYEGDTIRWYPNRPKNHFDTTVFYKNNKFWLGSWYNDDFPNTREKCKVIGNVYEEGGN